MKLHRNQFDAALEQIRKEEPDMDDVRFVASWLPDPRYVFLRRENDARRAVSQYRATLSGVWWRYGNGDPRRYAGIDPPIDPEAIHRLVLRGARQEEAWVDFFRRAGVVALTLTYEDLLLDLDRAVNKVLRHLDIDSVQDPRALRPRLVRQADDWTEEAVHRYVTWRRVHEPMEQWQYGYDHAR